MEGFEPNPQVNFEMMQQHIKGKVRLIGELMTMHDNVAQVKSSDGTPVNIELHTPCSFDTKFIEFQGTVMNPNTIKEDEHEEFGNEFDMQSYDKMVRLAHTAFRPAFMP